MSLFWCENSALHDMDTQRDRISYRMNTVCLSHTYLCPPCLLKAHASATTWPVALLTTGTQSMEEISQPNILDSCLRSSWEDKQQIRKLDRQTDTRVDIVDSLTALMSWRVIDFFFSTTWPNRPNISWTEERKEGDKGWPKVWYQNTPTTQIRAED